MKPSFHEDFGRADEVKSSSDRGFGLVFAGFFAVIGLLPLAGGGGPRIWALALAGAFLVVALAAPRLLAPANRQWTRFALLLGRATTPVVMALMYYGVFTPTGLLMRAFGADPLKRRLRRGDGASYWTERATPSPEPGAMKNMF